MAYSELIKNFNNIRSYMREFFVYGFKTREEYTQKSPRSYDDGRRRIEGYLGDAVKFRQEDRGKVTFISLEGSRITHNPLYKAFKAKSFTDKDITLHFLLLDLLADGQAHTLQELQDGLAERLQDFAQPLLVDDSTLRGKLKEYEKLGLLESHKEGKAVRYLLAKQDLPLAPYRDALRFATEENLLGVVGSFLEDRLDPANEFLQFKDHSIMNAFDAEVLEPLLQAISESRIVEICKESRQAHKEVIVTVLPLKLYVSTQGGRTYVFCYSYDRKEYLSMRVDLFHSVLVKDLAEESGEIREQGKNVMAHMWGVVCRNTETYDHVAMDIYVGEDESFILRRLLREKRCGTVTKLDDQTYRFTADVYSAREMVPWLRSYFGRILRLTCSNPEVKAQLGKDLRTMKTRYVVRDT